MKTRNYLFRFNYAFLDEAMDEINSDASVTSRQNYPRPGVVKKCNPMQHRYIDQNQSFPGVSIVNEIKPQRSASSSISASPTNVIRRRRVMRILEDLHTKQRQINGRDRLKYARKMKQEGVTGRKLTKTLSGRTLLELQIPTGQGNGSQHDIGYSSSVGNILQL